MGDDPVLTICVVAFVIVFIWVVLRRRHSLEIVVNNGRVTALRGVAQAHIRRVMDYLERDVGAAGKYTVVGSRDAQGVLRLNFRGNIDAGTRQQIRNYLKMIL